jgi:hypothetical protein
MTLCTTRGLFSWKCFEFKCVHSPQTIITQSYKVLIIRHGSSVVCPVMMGLLRVSACVSGYIRSRRFSTQNSSMSLLNSAQGRMAAEVRAGSGL